jgi:hypothetical protein
MGLQAAIAHVLVDDELRKELVANPERIQRQFSLSPEDMSLLRSSDPSALDRMSHRIRAKRLDFLERGLPCTVRAVSRRLLAEFARATIPKTESEDGGRVLAEARRFVSYLRNAPDVHILPIYLVELGEFELVRLELSSMATVAVPPPESGDLCEGSVVRLADHARICKFRFDVIALTEPGGDEKEEVVARDTAVVLKKKPTGGVVETYRIGETVYEALSLCATPRRISDLYSSIAPIDADAESHRARLFKTVRLGLETGILMREPASCTSAP